MHTKSLRHPTQTFFEAELQPVEPGQIKRLEIVPGQHVLMELQLKDEPDALQYHLFEPVYKQVGSRVVGLMYEVGKEQPQAEDNPSPGFIYGDIQAVEFEALGGNEVHWHERFSLRDNSRKGLVTGLGLICCSFVGEPDYPNELKVLYGKILSDKMHRRQGSRTSSKTVEIIESSRYL